MYCACRRAGEEPAINPQIHKSCGPGLAVIGRSDGLTLDRPVEKHGVTSHRDTSPLINLPGQWLLYL